MVSAAAPEEGTVQYLQVPLIAPRIIGDEQRSGGDLTGVLNSNFPGQGRWTRIFFVGIRDRRCQA